ncbi:hypothetical protein ACFE04_026786 [Oxalis oulophora]
MTSQFKPQNPLHLTTQKCTVGCPIIDECLSGGIPCDSITELVAESGTGKTQLCLQLCLSAQLPIALGGLAASSLYLHTEFPFPFRRLCQLSQSFQSRYPQLYVRNDNPLDYVFVQSVDNADELLDVLSKTNTFIENMRTRFPIRLIVIDSVAALFRSEFENTPRELKRRSSLFFKISSELKVLAMRFNLAVFVTNQVTDTFVANGGMNVVRVGNLGSLYSSGRRVSPALGLAWANCVNTRLFLSKNEEQTQEQNCEGEITCRQSKRQLNVVFAPHLPNSSCEFVITREGVYGVER